MVRTRLVKQGRERGLSKLTTVEHGQTTVRVNASGLPVTTHPGIAELVGTADLGDVLEGDELTNERLPEVQAVLGGVELSVDGGVAADVVGNAEDAALIEAGVELGGRRKGVLANDERSDLVAGGDDNDIGGGANLGQVGVESIGSGIGVVSAVQLSSVQLNSAPMKR